jgi:hypothetical protein
MKFAFESHQKTPHDQYIKEVVTFKFFDEHEIFYVPFFRKQAKDGGLFWSTASVGIQGPERKEYIDAFQLDSRSRLKSLLAFLEERRWEGANLVKKDIQQPQVQSFEVKQEASIQDDLPF